MKIEALITAHADKRRKRLGIPRKALKRLASKIISKADNFINYPSAIKVYCSNKIFNNKELNNKLVVHGEYVYVFDSERLITFFGLPTHLRKLVR